MKKELTYSAPMLVASENGILKVARVKAPSKKNK